VAKSLRRIVDAIERSGRRKNTLFVFCSDNGGPQPGVADNGSLRAGKGTLPEGGVRVCACAAWDGHIKPGSVVDQPLHRAVEVGPLVAPHAQLLRQGAGVGGAVAPILDMGQNAVAETVVNHVALWEGSERAS
jgi:hypothetical protein